MKHTMEGKTVASGAVGAAIGGAQVYALRSYADKVGTPLVASLGPWGQPSALIDLGLGMVGSVVGLWSYTKGTPIRSKPVSAGLAGYGLVTLAGGIFSGMRPAVATMVKAPQRLAEQVPAQVIPQRGLTVVPTSRERTPGIVIRSLQT